MFELILRKQALASGSALITQELDEHYYPRQRRTYKLFDMADCLMTAPSRRCNLEKAPVLDIISHQGETRESISTGKFNDLQTGTWTHFECQTGVQVKDMTEKQIEVDENFTYSRKRFSLIINFLPSSGCS